MQEQVSGLLGNHSELILGLGYKGLLVIAVLFASLLAAGIIRRIIKHGAKRLDATVVSVLSATVSYLVYAVGIIIILDVFGVNTTSIIALLGAAGLAVGLALKGTLSNIAAGVMLLVLRPFQLGDYIEFGAVGGTVREINLFTSILETVDGLYVSAPNGLVWSNTIKNYTRNGKRRMDVVVGIAYSDSIDSGLKVLQEICRSEPRLLQDPAPQTMVVAMGESSVNLQIRAWSTMADYWPTCWDLTKRIKEELEGVGLTIPFPQRDVHMVDMEKTGKN